MYTRVYAHDYWNVPGCPSGPGSFYLVDNMSDKEFKTTDELIQLLIKRGMKITGTQKSYAKKSLQRYGYYNLINGYNKLFITTKIPEDKFKNGTTIEEIVALYEFDCKLRNVFLTHILPFEINVKALIAYHFSKAYGYDNYLLFNNFDTSQKDAHKKIADVISDFQRQLSTRANDPSIMHYLKQYGYVPLWVINNILTFGHVSKFYSIMKQKDKMAISKTFHIMDDQLQSILFYLSTVRNFCAHGNRLYCYRSQRPLIDMNIHNTLNIPINNNEYIYGKRDLFACLLGLSYVLSKKEFRSILKEIDDLLKEIKPNLHVINTEDILNEMGFPTDWKRQLS